MARSEVMTDLTSNDLMLIELTIGNTVEALAVPRPSTGAAGQVRATKQQKSIYRLTRRHTDGSMDASGVYDRLIGVYSRPSTARLAGDRHEGMSDRPLRMWNARRGGGYWWRYSRLGLYLYEVKRLEP
jgi:hypothetical protein